MFDMTVLGVDALEKLIDALTYRQKDILIFVALKNELSMAQEAEYKRFRVVVPSYNIEATLLYEEINELTAEEDQFLKDFNLDGSSLEKASSLWVYSPKSFVTLVDSLTYMHGKRFFLVIPESIHEERPDVAPKRGLKVCFLERE